MATGAEVTLDLELESGIVFCKHFNTYCSSAECTYEMGDLVTRGMYIGDSDREQAIDIEFNGRSIQGEQRVFRLPPCPALC